MSTSERLPLSLKSFGFVHSYHWQLMSKKIDRECLFRRKTDECLCHSPCLRKTGFEGQTALPLIRRKRLMTKGGKDKNDGALTEIRA